MDSGDSRKESLAKASVSGLGWNYFGVFARNASAFVIGIPLARMLGPKPFGQVALAWSVIALGNLLADLGFSSAIIQRDRLEKTDIRFVFTLQMIFGCVWFSAVFVSAPLVAGYFRDPGLTPVLRWLAGMFLIQAAGQIATGLLRRQLAFRRIQTAQVTSYLLAYVFLGLPMAWTGWGVWAIVWAQLLQGALYTAMVYAWVRHSVVPCFQSSGGRRLGAFGMKVLATNLCNWTIGNIDNVMVGRWLGAVSLGLYARVFSLITAPLNSIITTLQSVLFPFYARVQEDRALQLNMYTALFEGLALLTMPLFLGIAVIAPTVMVGLFGEQWAAAAPILGALSAAMPFLALLGLAGPLLWGIGRVELELRIQFLVAILSAIILAWAARGTVVTFGWAVCGLYVFRFLLMTTQIVAVLNLPVLPLLRALAISFGLALVSMMTLRGTDVLVRGWGMAPPAALFLDVLAFLVAGGTTLAVFRRRLYSPSLKWLVSRLLTHIGRNWHGPLRWLFDLETA